MLAQNFKTPADLGIKDAEFEALAKVLGMLELCEIKPYCEDQPYPPTGFFFYMASFGTTTECGTVGCIAGFARAITNNRVFPWANDDNRVDQPHIPLALQALFYPPMSKPWGDITPSEAAIALRSYLTHGEPRWDEALAA